MRPLPTTIERYFQYNRLQVFPRKLKNKRLILDYIIEDLEMGKQYTAFDINLMIQAYYEDYATLRRAMVDDGYLNRDKAGQVYWRLK